MSEQKTDFLTPVGRLVQGDPFKGSDTGYQGKKLTDRNNNPRMEWYVGIAIPKTDPAWPAFWQILANAAAIGFPGGQAQQPTFSWKVADGDGPELVNKEGMAGHWLVRMSSGFAPDVYTTGGAAKIVDPTAVKRGDYVRVYGTVAPNGDMQKPGIFVNVNMVEFIGYGEAIKSGPDGAAVFGGQPAALPPGASATPIGGTPIAQGPGVPGAPAPAPAAPGAPAATPAPGTPPGGMPAAPGAPAPAAAPAPGVQPAPDFLGTGGAPAPAAPAGPQMAPGCPYTYEALKAANWSDEQMRAAGHLL